jgi:26S proteasome regulatory subunit T1
LATRVRHLEALPFIVGTNPYVATTLNAYRESFQWLATYPRVTNLEQNEAFTAELEHLVESHANDIPTMAKGYTHLLFPFLPLTKRPMRIFYSFQECSRYMSPTQISDFLDGAIRNRISVRLIAEQHIALSRALKSPLEEQNVTHNGIVNMKCSPLDMVRMCGSFVGELCEATLGASPPLVINGHEDATFPCVSVFGSYNHY